MLFETDVVEYLSPLTPEDPDVPALPEVPVDPDVPPIPDEPEVEVDISVLYFTILSAP